MTMETYFAWVRSTISSDSMTDRRPRGAEIYRELVRLQHRQALLAMFGPLEERAGARAFDAWCDELRRTSPPSDPQPSRWARPFAELVAADAPKHAELADYLATRVEVAIALDDRVELRSYARDPRPKRPPQACVIAIFRRDDGRVAELDAGAAEVAAIGLAMGEADRVAIARAGIREADVAAARARLAELGLRLP